MISGSAGISGATDSNFVLKAKKHGSRQATLYCTGRDIEYQEYTLQFDGEKHIWEMKSENIDTPQKQADPLLKLLIEFLKALNHFNGTETQLSELLEQRTNEKILPGVLSKKLVRYAWELSAAGISVTASRTRDSRFLHIRCDDNDGNDGKITILPVADLLSQPSHLSRQYGVNPRNVRRQICPVRLFSPEYRRLPLYDKIDGLGGFRRDVGGNQPFFEKVHLETKIKQDKARGSLEAPPDKPHRPAMQIEAGTYQVV